MQVKPEEFRTTRELAREVVACLEAVRSGDVEKIVVTQNGKPAGVLLGVEAYERLVHDADTLRDQLAGQLRGR
jgi:prevent-host-death family protein